MTSTQVRCPRCHTRLCDRLPNGLAAGRYVCRCKLELIIEYTWLTEITLIVVPPELQADLAPVTQRYTPDGRGLVLWADYQKRR